MKYAIAFLIAFSAFASNDIVLKRAASFVLKKNEGVRHTPYKCSNGHWTIGVGHKIKKGESFGKIDDATVNKLLNEDLDEHIARCKRALPKFDTYPIQVRVSIIDGFFRGCLAGSPKALALMRQNRFVEASKEYLDHKGYRKSKKQGTGVYKRMDKNARVFEQYGEKLNEK